MTESAKKAPRGDRRAVIQFRVKFDPEMGAAYERLMALPPRKRARETIFMVRAFAEGRSGAMGAPSTTNGVPAPPRAGPAGAEQQQERTVGKIGASASVLNRMTGIDD